MLDVPASVAEANCRSVWTEKGRPFGGALSRFKGFDHEETDSRYEAVSD